MSDPFQVLGVERTATDADIKSAYRKLAKQYHPDRNQGDASAEAKFKEIGAAYEILKDPAKRAEASRPRHEGHPFAGMGRGGFQQRGFTAGGFAFEFDRDEGTFRTHVHPGAGGGGAGAWSPPPPQNTHFHVLTTISLEDAAVGKLVDVQVAGINGERYVQVKVPPGAQSGMRLRVAGQGDNRVTNAPPGDLFVTIRIADHPLFVRVAQNLYMGHEIDVFDAMLGTQFDVRTLEGKTVQVNVPPGIQHGQQLRISGHGMPIVGGPETMRGHIIVEIHVVVPTLNDAQKEHVRAAKAAIEPKAA